MSQIKLLLDIIADVRHLGDSLTSYHLNLAVKRIRCYDG